MESKFVDERSTTSSLENPINRRFEQAAINGRDGLPSVGMMRKK